MGSRGAGGQLAEPPKEPGGHWRLAERAGGGEARQPERQCVRIAGRGVDSEAPQTRHGG
ncbi:hypothetical protein DB31_8961 [Hyalangium minutum]|uniref:Uncharacterized protein n=1 Tax=Hyalangium minutum TaxID=394096 RepID=A0A085WGD4_9BACT|nr:hypothetical protein DB31_8961 [Hyalangium minutum]